MWKRLFLAIFILLSFEVGFFLIIVPWSTTWENNLFLNSIEWLQGILMSPFLRGAVSGLGVLNIFLGLGEAWHFRDRIRQMEAHEASQEAAEKSAEEQVAEKRE
jgi:hypothetical protein